MNLDRRTVIRWGLGVGAFGMTGAWVRRLAAMVPPGIQTLRGEARINGARAKVGTTVAPGDHVTTGAEAQAVVAVGKDVYLLRSDTDITIPDASPAERFLTVTSGRLLSVFANDPLTIDTPVATIGIRGTGAYVEVYDDRTYVCLCYGRAELRSKVSPDYAETLNTIHHDAPRNFFANPAAHRGQAVEPAPMVNHEDRELIMLEALMGRVPLFGPEPVEPR